ncbi:hypothetical protein AR687_10410 [Flavobacteriaceae bacterium CRH]|nr:hypothetical protein AR687_10410 [Flavobacteriaceae bacterium CRH]
MKNLLFLIPFLLLFQASYGDVVPINSHPVKRCVKIINIEDFPDFSILACIQSPMKKDITASFINSNDCIEKGYKFNALYIMATRRSYLEGKLANSTDWLNDRNVIESSISINTSDTNASNDDPISSIEEYYEIVEITNTNFVIYKCRELIRYNDGSPIKLKNYPYVQNQGKRKNIKNNEKISEIYPSTEIVNFLLALLFTIFIETLILFLLFKTKYKKLNINNKLLLFTGFITSFSTLPYVWFIFPAFIHSRFPYILFSECFAIAMESFIIYKLLKIEFKKAILVSIIANVISFGIGLLINWDSVYNIFTSL